MSLDWLPNCITILRMVGTGALLFFEPTSRAFLVLYAITGITDVLDGTLARALHLTSDTGARLDSVADLLFYSTVLLSLLTTLRRQLPWWIWPWVGLILAIRLATYLIAYRKTGAFSALHTLLNKATGACVFLIPFLLNTCALTPWCLLVCLLATAASVQELSYYMISKK